MSRHIVLNGVPPLTDASEAVKQAIAPEPTPAQMMELLQVQMGMLETILLRIDKIIAVDDALSESARLKTESAPPENHE